MDPGRASTRYRELIIMDLCYMPIEQSGLAALTGLADFLALPALHPLSTYGLARTISIFFTTILLSDRLIFLVRQCEQVFH